MTTTRTHTEQSLPLPPGNFGLPIIGETIEFLHDPNFISKRENQYGSIFKTHLFGRPTVVMIGAEANHFVLTNENRYFEMSWPHSTKVLLGPASVGVQIGSEHQKRRKILSQAFQPRALASYVSSMENMTRKYLQEWERTDTLTWYPAIKKYTLDVGCKLLAGIDAASDGDFGKLFQKWVEGMFSIPVQLPWTKFGLAIRSRQLLLQHIEQILLKRQQEPSSSQDAVGLLLQARDEDGNSLSLQELKDQVLTLLVTSHETLTSAIASFCLLLAQHPEVLEVARAEQQQFNLEEPLTFEHLKSMSYLEQVLKEVLRVIPPVGGGFREVLKSCEFNGYSLPQDWSIFYQIGNTHQDSSIYMQPECFEPHRFAPERAEDKAKPFSYVPFGGGVRECLGKEFAKLELKLFAAMLIREYEWELLPEQNLDMIMLPIAHPREGLKVRFRRRVDGYSLPARRIPI